MLTALAVASYALVSEAIIAAAVDYRAHRETELDRLADAVEEAPGRAGDCGGC